MDARPVRRLVLLLSILGAGALAIAVGIGAIPHGPPKLAAKSAGTHGRTTTSVLPSVSTPSIPMSGPTTAPRTTTNQGPLVGKVVVLDPGHNGGNAGAPSVINQMIWNGRESETCDTTGTETDSGYTEALFNFNVAQLAASDLEAEGATVILTRNNNSGVGPCVTQRAAIGNQAHADAAVSIHADGGPPSGRGFAILLPVADGVNSNIIGPSTALGTDLRQAFLADTGMPVSTYDGVDGLQTRSDLAGTNLSTVPKVFIECGNMRNSLDASLLTDPSWQARAARGITQGITSFLTAGVPTT